MGLLGNLNMDLVLDDNEKTLLGAIMAHSYVFKCFCQLEMHTQFFTGEITQCLQFP